jgi:hypothetical protein
LRVLLRFLAADGFLEVDAVAVDDRGEHQQHVCDLFA